MYIYICVRVCVGMCVCVGIYANVHEGMIIIANFLKENYSLHRHVSLTIILIEEKESLINCLSNTINKVLI